MPKIIKTSFDAKLIDPKSNREETAAFLADKPHDFYLPNWIGPYGYELLCSRPVLEDEGTKQTIALVFQGRTVYKVKTFVRNSPNAYMSKKNCTQLIVWRDFTHADNVTLHGFANRVFDHLLSLHDIMISDEHQSEDGKRFWLYRIGEALATPDRHVYYIDLNELDDDMIPIMTEIQDVDELKEKYLPLGWGCEPEFKDKAFVISGSSAK